VLTLARPLPPLHALRALGPRNGGPDAGPLREWVKGVRADPRSIDMDGIPVRYVTFVSPPRPLSYGDWGRWSAPPLGRALDALRSEWPFDLVHAHNAVPAGDAALRWIASRAVEVPLVVSVHGTDLSFAAHSKHGRAAVSRTLRGAGAVIANSEVTGAGIVELTGDLASLRAVHPGADVSQRAGPPHAEPTLVTVAHLEPHKGQEDVIRALAALRSRHPTLRYVLVGKGPNRAALEALARQLGVSDRIFFRGALSHGEALAELSRCQVHVMPSSREPFGVAHIEAMAAGIPTIGGAGTGTEDIARAGDGALLVRPGDVAELARTIDALISDEGRRERLGQAARRTVEERFSWARCGVETVSAYSEAFGLIGP
jgi:teichuronic acid biosynthesis glycosyltransferase TuaC